MPLATAAESAAISTQAAGLLDIYDAIGDLALAEGVHQAVQGNFERIAATLDAYTTGNFPPEPEVIQTPPSGVGLTHRVAVHFTAGLAPQATATPRAMAEPALDAWLAAVLPPLDDIQCQVVWKDPVSAANQTRTVSLENLAISPIDALDLLKPDNVQSMTELDDRILGYVISTSSPRPDAGAWRIHKMNG